MALASWKDNHRRFCLESVGTAAVSINPGLHGVNS